jgi:hypothetical protein
MRRWRSLDSRRSQPHWALVPDRLGRPAGRDKPLWLAACASRSPSCASGRRRGPSSPRSWWTARNRYLTRPGTHRERARLAWAGRRCARARDAARGPGRAGRCDCGGVEIDGIVGIYRTRDTSSNTATARYVSSSTSASGAAWSTAPFAAATNRQTSAGSLPPNSTNCRSTTQPACACSTSSHSDRHRTSASPVLDGS